MPVADKSETDNKVYPPNAAHLMRTAQLAQLQLSAMADTKASILMGATFVIFTITIGRAHDGSAPIPLLILGGAAFLASICTILAVLPKTAPKPKESARPNILFFGTFTHMQEDEFVEALLTQLETEDRLYRTIARDIYQGGMVLQQKKYRMLGHAYRIFLAGLVASCAAYVYLYVV
jgi:hypothetical protein